MSKGFYFMRHGQTDWNKQNIYMGSKDIPLNSDGIKQAEAVLTLLPTSVQYIVSSPLQRAIKTAEIVAGVLKKPMKIIDGFKECYWGEKEGQVINYEDTRQEWWY